MSKELEALSRLCIRKRRLCISNFLHLGSLVRKQISILILYQKLVILSDFYLNSSLRIHKVDCSLNLALCEVKSASCRRVIGAVKFFDTSVFVFDDFLAFDEVCTLESHLITWEESEVLLCRNFHKVCAVNVKFI